MRNFVKFCAGTGLLTAFFAQDENGEFKYRYLLLDMPSTFCCLFSLPETVLLTMWYVSSWLLVGSRVREPRRLFVETGQGFTERDSVIMVG